MFKKSPLSIKRASSSDVIALRNSTLEGGNPVSLLNKLYVERIAAILLRQMHQ